MQSMESVENIENLESIEGIEGIEGVEGIETLRECSKYRGYRVRTTDSTGSIYLFFKYILQLTESIARIESKMSCTSAAPEIAQVCSIIVCSLLTL